MTNTFAEKLQSLGIALPTPPAPVASYVGFVRQDNLLFVSGQLPFEQGKLSHTGLLGRDVEIEGGVAAARNCAINLLAQVAIAVGGELGRVEQCIRLGGFVASAPEFHDHPKVVNGASDLVVDVLEEAGKHCRAAVGVAALPMNASVEVAGLFALR